MDYLQLTSKLQDTLSLFRVPSTDGVTLAHQNLCEVTQALARPEFVLSRQQKRRTLFAMVKVCDAFSAIDDMSFEWENILLLDKIVGEINSLVDILKDKCEN